MWNNSNNYGAARGRHVVRLAISLIKRDYTSSAMNRGRLLDWSKNRDGIIKRLLSPLGPAALFGTIKNHGDWLALLYFSTVTLMLWNDWNQRHWSFQCPFSINSWWLNDAGSETEDAGRQLRWMLDDIVQIGWFQHVLVPVLRIGKCLDVIFVF